MTTSAKSPAPSRLSMSAEGDIQTTMTSDEIEAAAAAGDDVAQ